MAVPKKKKSRSKKGSHFSNFLKNFKTIADSKNTLINSIPKHKRLSSFLFISSKLNLTFLN